MDDFRVKAGWFDHPKCRHLLASLGTIGPFSLMRLWAYAAGNKPDGDLSGMSDHLICMAAGYQCYDENFIAACTTPGLEVIDGEQNHRKLHDWEQHNPWCAGHKDRQARAARAASAPRKYKFHVDDEQNDEAQLSAKEVNDERF